jgi:hypothetical protein
MEYKEKARRTLQAKLPALGITFSLPNKNSGRSGSPASLE